jgi:hypothetical protein
MHLEAENRGKEIPSKLILAQVSGDMLNAPLLHLDWQSRGTLPPKTLRGVQVLNISAG